MKKDFDIQIPKWMQPDFGKVVQSLADESGRELSSQELYTLFQKEYIQEDNSYQLIKCHIDSDEGESDGLSNQKSHIISRIRSCYGGVFEFESYGNGPIDAFVKGLKKELNMEFTIEKYAEHAISHGEDAQAIAFIMLKDEQGKESFGSAIDPNISLASLKTVLSALSRLLRK